MTNRGPNFTFPAAPFSSPLRHSSKEPDRGGNPGPAKKPLRGIYFHAHFCKSTFFSVLATFIFGIPFLVAWEQGQRTILERQKGEAPKGKSESVWSLHMGSFRKIHFINPPEVEDQVVDLLIYEKTAAMPKYQNPPHFFNE